MKVLRRVGVVLALAASVVVTSQGLVAAELATSSVTVDSGVVDIDIPTGAPGTTLGPAAPSSLVVSESGRVADVVVGIRVDHTFDNDLDITLTSPDGTTLDLTSDNGFMGDDYGTAGDCTSTAGLTVFDDAAPTSITAGTAPFVGSFMPEEALSGLENETLAGTWTLDITDDLVNDFGKLVCWTLIIDYAGPLAGADVCNQLAWDGSDDGVTSQVWVANSNGEGRTEISSVGSGTDPTDNRLPEWSPDGTRIAWSGFDGATFQIWVADPDGTNRVEISSVGSGTDPTDNASPAWSPDGTRIAWSGSDGATNQIWVADPDGTNRVEISSVGSGTDPTDNASPAWSPDGTRIAWSGSDGATNQIWVADPDGTDRALISDVSGGPDPTDNFSPVWSPDGTRIAWRGFDGGVNQIWVADADGANRALISTVAAGPDPTFNSLPVWSPDGARIAWHGSDGAISQIYVADADGTSREEISSVELSPDPIFNGFVDWRGWYSQLDLSTTTSGVEDTQITMSTATVTNTGPCPSGSVVVTGLSLSCVAAPAVSATAGSVTGSTWTIPSLAAGATATATISGTVATGACSSPLKLTAAPATAGPVNATVRACSSSGTPFTDISASFAAADIACIYHLAITTGTSPTTYSPADDVTREQMAAFLARLWRSLGNTCPTGTTPFTDISSSFAAADIACIYHLTITTGTSPTTYSPLNDVTREQMAAFLARLWRIA